METETLPQLDPNTAALAMRLQAALPHLSDEDAIRAAREIDGVYPHRADEGALT